MHGQAPAAGTSCRCHGAYLAARQQHLGRRLAAHHCGVNALACRQRGAAGGCLVHLQDHAPIMHDYWCF